MLSVLFVSPGRGYSTLHPAGAIFSDPLAELIFLFKGHGVASRLASMYHYLILTG